MTKSTFVTPNEKSDAPAAKPSTLQRQIQHEVENAGRIANLLFESMDTYEVAIENETAARSARKTAEDVYEAAEGDLIAQAYADGSIDGSNGEKRKAQERAFLALARNHGTLHDAWQESVRWTAKHEGAKSQREQAEVRYAGMKRLAELQGAILYGLAAK